ncbi:hypothetical protein B0H17DRAFT_1032536 [Mycena rosella]|uniref:DUF6533 domain-containing protein n=1 Tax=Mycena rosella TaxID=1033263 RepID=A0AAD7M9X4_MYCRO|nr:hypothetical protein B0H17DRAFT_1032536 [Mycena rosella]
MSSPSELEAELLQLIADTQTTNYLVAASLTLAVIEHVATFKDELKLVWNGPLRISSVIYIWMRYFALITLIIYSTFMLREVKSDYTCQSFLLAEGVTSSLIVVTADIILVLRVWILYGRPRKLLYFLLALVTAEIITMIIVAVFTILPLREYFHIGYTILGCYSLRVPRYFTFYAVPLVVTSFTMFGMTLYKCGRTLFDNRAARMPVITLFLRDGVFWFLAIFAISVAELLVWARGRPGLAQATVSPATVLNSVIGTRILLNLKRLGATDSVSDTTVPNIELESLATPRGKLAISSQPWYLRTADTRDV